MDDRVRSVRMWRRALGAVALTVFCAATGPNARADEQTPAQAPAQTPPSPPTQPPATAPGQGPMQGRVMPPAATEACAKLKAGDACSFQGHRGRMHQGTCQAMNQAVACVPNDMHGNVQGGMGGYGGHHF